ncbi:hypothetical protein HYH02_009032 [Chlamydomonas schloesseri]|uniref:EF-hand domain-containing protein n=1 Tax=Chlamydomonas schloesseri TaxID=2026947 RepID=A0A835WB56_9CHLO|nr:hypothetical protein HYH02_009032 [Chlamydomonas schloesseri]|eukprot:KAG2444090.1 hypothetical protein HYH02_009032 [Chlamydomonas schloesseri]
MAGVDPYVARLWFESVDADGSGLLDAKELRQAFDIGGLGYSLQQAHQFVRAFDSKGNHKLNVNEFVELHRFLSAVTDAFSAVSKGSKTITAADAPQALARLGYTLDPHALNAVLLRHDTDVSGTFARDDFLRISLFLHTARRGFTAFDTQRSGKIELNFNQLVYAASYLA